MGTANSRPSEEVLATLSTKSRKKYDLNYPNYLESKAFGIDKYARRGSIISREKRKQSSASEDSSLMNAAVLSTSLLSSSPPPPPPPAPPPGVTMSECPTIPIEYEIKNGRRYMISNTNRMYLPCDDDEADRIVVLHFCIKYAFQGNVIAPVIESLRAKPNQNDGYSSRVLDVGCGPGTWILDMATEFPFTEFHGIDIRTMFPTTIKPPNAQFIQHDFLQANLPYASNSFEFVRMQLMITFLTEKQFLHLLSEIHRVLKPDGYFEILDCEYQVQRPGPLCERVLNQDLPKTLHSALGTITHMPSHCVSTSLTLHGFVNVHQQLTHIPIGWGGQLGEVHAQNLIGHLRSIHPDVKQKLSLLHSDVDIDDLLTDAARECTVRQSHVNWFVCYGQKPTTVNNLMIHPHHTTTTTTTTTTTAFSVASPISSPNSSCINVKQSKGISTPAWDSIYDFVDGYID